MYSPLFSIKFEITEAIIYKYTIPYKIRLIFMKQRKKNVNP